MKKVRITRGDLVQIKLYLFEMGNRQFIEKNKNRAGRYYDEFISEIFI